MRGPRVTGNPAAAGSPAPVGHPAAETPAPAGHPAAGSPVPAASPAARTPSGVIPGSRPAEGDGHPAGERGPEPARGLRRLAGRCLRLAREHWLLTALLAAGLALRVLAQIAYRPALIYI